MDSFISPATLERLWFSGAKALAVAILVEALAFVGSLLLRRKLSPTLARGGGLDGSFRLERRRRVAHHSGMALRWGLWAIGLLIILDIFGVNTLPILIVFAVLALAAVGATWRILSDVAAGLFLLIDDALAVGDTATINGTTGRVEEVGMRWVRLLDDKGSSHLVFNSSIRQLVNHSRSPQAVSSGRASESGRLGR